MQKNFKEFILLFTLLNSVVLLPIGTVLALPLVASCYFIRLLKFIWGILGVSLMSLMWMTQSLSPVHIVKLNHSLFQCLIQGNCKFSIYMIVLTLPFAMVLSCWIATLIEPASRLHKELIDVCDGKLKVKRNFLNEKAILRQLKKIPHQTIEDGSILGVDYTTGKPVVLNDESANMHTLAIGTTGSGKTTSILNIVESAIVRNLPLIYVDGKGDIDLANRIKLFAEKNNRPFYLFSMVGESVKYNPIAQGGITSKKDRIIELRVWSEDHYRKIAEGYLQTVFAILEKYNIEIDLKSLSQYLYPDALYDLAREKKDSSVIQEIERLEGKVKDIQSLIAEIENMSKSEIGALFDTKEGKVLTLAKAFEENAIVYFCLQPLTFPAYAECLGKLIINDIKALAATQLNKKIKTKIYTLFDEFSLFVGDQVINLINQGRGAGIHAVLSTQSSSDIVRKGDDALLGQILNNCNNFIIQRQNNHDDAETLAKLIGTKDTFQVTSQLDNISGNKGTGSVRTTKEFTVHPDEIKEFRRGEGVVVDKANGNIHFVKFRNGI